MSETVEYMHGCGVWMMKNKDGYQHSYYDEPSHMSIWGAWYYYSYHINGEWHRDDAPAVIKCGKLKWYSNGVSYKPRCQKL